MKKNFVNRILTAALVVFAFTLTTTAQDKQQTKPVVMIVGSYHMSNPGRDVSNVKADDVLAEKRQREIAEFVHVLKKFKPTRVAVEEPGTNEKLNERYARYLKGEYQLTANETDQIGFRLAKDLNHPRVYTIDWQGPFDFDKMLASATANNQIAVTDGITNTFKGFGTEFAEKMKTSTITELYRYLNDEKSTNEKHRPYLTGVCVGKGDDYAGADLAAQWYARNLKIFANITRLAETPNERILVVIGSGHLKLLQEFVEQSGEFDLERLSKYL